VKPTSNLLPLCISTPRAPVLGTGISIPEGPSSRESAALAESHDEFVYRTEVRFNAIYVLESLGPGEPKTGRDLYDSVILPKSSALGDAVYTEIATIPNEEALHAKLAFIAYAARQANHHPVVHLEAHGDEKGIQLADGTLVSWRSVVPRLAEINQACKMNLIVVAMACKGWGLTYALMPAERAPVFMLVGPPENITAADLLDATRRFYTALIEYMDVNRALEAMNNHLPFGAWPIRPATSEILFCRVFRMYLDEFASPEALQERENTVVANIARVRRLDVLQTAALRSHMRPHLADRRWWYDHFREQFLMLDLFPDSRWRFGLTYDLCLGDTSATKRT
jgi:hypothetical protein